MTISLSPGNWSAKLYPGESNADVQEKIDEAIAWAVYWAPCIASASWSDTGPQADLVRSIIKRALRYDKETADGSVVSRTAGPFGMTLDNRKTTTANLFNQSQIEVLRSMCGQPAQFGAITVPLGSIHDPV